MSQLNRYRFTILVLLLAVLVMPSSMSGQGTLQVGYVRVTANAGNRIPVGTALFTFTNSSGVLVSQAGVGTTEPIRNGRIFVDGVGTRTGIALVNSSAQPATVTLSLRDTGGREVNRTSLSLAAGQHRPAFVDALFNTSLSGFVGSLTFQSDQPLAAVTLRENRNALGEPLYATLPVLDLSIAGTTQPIIFPHIAAGDGYTTQLVLVNRTSTRVRGRVRLIASSGQPLVLRLAGSGVSDFAYDIDADGAYRVELDSVTGLQSGYAVVTPDPGNQLPGGTAIFRYFVSGSIVTEAGVAATPSTTAARIFVDNAGTRTGVALVNSGTEPAELSLTLMDRGGISESTVQRTLQPGNHLAIFVNDLFSNINEGFTGQLEIRSNRPVTPITLKLTINSRGHLILTTLPVADLNAAYSGSTIVFPQLAIGGEFSTRLILLNSDTSNAAAGRLNFYQSNAANMTIPLGAETGAQFTYQLARSGGRQFYPGMAVTVGRVSLIDPLSNLVTRELVVNEGATVRPRIIVHDNRNVARDDVDVTLTSSGADVATVDVLGNIYGRSPGFSTLRMVAGSYVESATITVIGVNSGLSGYGTKAFEDRAGRVYLVSAEEHILRRAETLKDTPEIYAGVLRSPGLRNDLRLQSQFRNPFSAVFDYNEGSIYVSDSSNHVIRKIQPGTSGRVETFAGTGVAGYVNGPAAQAAFRDPQGLAMDNQGNLWVVDSGNHVIRRINVRTRAVETVAGRPGNAGRRDGRGSEAQFNAPKGIALEPESETAQLLREQRGVLTVPPDVFIVADTGNGVLRRVNANGEVATIEGTVQAISMEGKRIDQPLSFSSPTDVAVDPSGNIYVTEPASGRVRTLLQSGALVPATQANTFERPVGLTISETGRLLVADDKRPVREIRYGAPQITLIEPYQVSSRGGQTITISGRSFEPGSIVVIGGVIVRNITVVDTETIRLTVPALPSGITTVTVKTRGGLGQKSLFVEAIALTSLPAGYVTTVAGGSVFTGDGSRATQARLSSPAGVAIDPVAGDIYIADERHHRIRRVEAATGIITTVAGTGRGGYTPETGLAVASALQSPGGIAFDSARNLYIADTDNNRIVRLDPQGRLATVAGGVYNYFENGSIGDGLAATEAVLSSPSAVLIDANGNLYIADTGQNRIRRVDAATGRISTVAGNGEYDFSGDNGPAVNASLKSPYGIAIDRAGNLYIADTGNNRVRKVDALSRAITTIAGTGEDGYSGDRGPAVRAELSGPSSVAIDNNDNIVIADSWNSVIRRISSTGVITTVAGNGEYGFFGDNGPALQAMLDYPTGAVLDASGNIVFSDRGNQRVRRVSPAGIITTIAGADPAGSSGDGQSATAATLTYPVGIALDASNNLIIADSGNSRVRQVSNGIITTIAGTGRWGFSGDGGPARSAEISEPSGIATDQQGNILFADSGNDRIRRIEQARGVITTIAGSDTGPLAWPSGVAVDAAGNVYVADTDNNQIRRIAAGTNAVSVVAGTGRLGFSGDGGPAAQATLDYPTGVAVDPAGNIYVADTFNNRIRKIAAGTNIITTFAGNGDFYGDLGESGPATDATLSFPTGVAVDPAGDVYIADTCNGIIRNVWVATGLIATVAGNGDYGFSGDNGPATSATFADPNGILIDRDGNIY
ncbi:MAG: SBBP repeat-containing protein, partial [Acidobacteria bacterium]|nr:SBBP repeat-containing protein [Acidobacteriota bacterium]